MSDAGKRFLQGVARFAADRLAPQAAGWSMGGTPGAEIWREAGALGLTGIEVARDKGGLGLGFAVKAEACAILAAVDFGAAMALVNSHNVAARLALSAAPDLQAALLPGLLSGEVMACTALTEPGAGSDAASMRTAARRSAEGWVLDGEKAWIINARHAGIAIVHARCDGLPGGAGIGAFVVDLTAPAVNRYPLDGPLGQTTLGTGGFTLDAVQVPHGNLILPPGTAFRSILSEINGARAYVAAMCCAMLGAALDEAVAFGQTRQSFGAPLAAHQGWRLPMAAAHTDLAAARALTDLAVSAVGNDLPDAQLRAAQAKVHAVATCQRHLPRVLHAMGAAGLRPESRAARHLAAVQSAALTDGATDMLLERVARLTGIAPPAAEKHKG